MILSTNRLVFAAESIKLAQGIAKGRGVAKSMKHCRRLEGRLHAARRCGDALKKLIKERRN